MFYDPFAECDIIPKHHGLPPSSCMNRNGYPSYNPFVQCNPAPKTFHDPFGLCNPEGHRISKSMHPQQERLNRIYGAPSPNFPTLAATNSSASSHSSTISTGASLSTTSSSSTKPSLRTTLLRTLHRRSTPRLPPIVLPLAIPSFTRKHRRDGYIRAPPSPPLAEATTLLHATPSDSPPPSSTLASQHTSDPGRGSCQDPSPLPSPAPGREWFDRDWDAAFALDWTRGVLASSLEPSSSSPSSYSSSSSAFSEEGGGGVGEWSSPSSCVSDSGSGSEREGDGLGDVVGGGEEEGEGVDDGWSFQCRGYGRGLGGAMVALDEREGGTAGKRGSGCGEGDKWKRQLGW